MRASALCRMAGVEMVADAPVSATEPADSGPAPAARARWLQVRLPAALLGLLFVLLGLFVATQADAYGRTFDEELQDQYGHAVLAWYLSGGEDQSFLQFHPSQLMPQHGPFMETVVAAVQDLTGETWTTRSVVTASVAVLGVAAIALCGFELGGWWLALLSALGLALYPRYLGAMFNNSKDMPVAVIMLVVLWLALRMLRRWDRPRAYLLDSTLIGIGIGAAAAIRVPGMVWYGVLGFVAVGWWLRHGRTARASGAWRAELAKQATAAVLVGCVSFLTICALWPYVFLDPIPNLLDSISAMGRYPLVREMPLGGQLYSTDALPRRYIFEWLLIGSPPPVAVFAVVGSLIAVAHLVRIRTTGRPGVMLAGIYLAVPLAVLVWHNPTMYNGPRHFFFLFPAIILLAAYGFVRSLAFLARRRQRVLAGVVAGAVLFGQAHAVKTMLDIHPYEYAYFSPVVGGVAGAAGKYEVDYWGTCNKVAAEWLAANYRDHTAKPPGEPVSLRTSVLPFMAFIYLPQDDFQWADEPDFYIWSMHDWFSDEFPDYETIFEEKIDGFPVCVVKKRP